MCFCLQLSSNGTARVWIGSLYQVKPTKYHGVRTLTIDLVISMELIKQVAFSAKLSKSSEADIVLKELGFTQS